MMVKTSLLFPFLGNLLVMAKARVYSSPLWCCKVTGVQTCALPISNRLDYLYEISHVPEDSKIPITDFPIVNPYTIFNKPQSSFKKP